jgi:N-acetylmuramoyl-L-alanine amidase
VKASLHPQRRTRLASVALANGALKLVIWALLSFAPQVAAATETPQPERSGAPVAVSARLVEEGKTARLTFDLSSSIEARAFALADPDRIVIDIPEVNFQIDPSVGRVHAHAPGAIVKMFRFGLLGPGKSRIVIDLGEKAQVDRILVRPIAPGAEAARLEIDLSVCDPAAFARALKAEEGNSATPAARDRAAGAPAEGLPVVVLDPGHGGIDGGAAGPAGEIEKTIVYDFTRELARKLEERKRFRVVLTRDGDEFVSLGDRVKIAREANASLLISIHADTLADAADVSGATVYTLADRASDSVAARVAESENAADKAAGVEQKAEAAGVADILFDLKRRETRTYAHLFSRGVVQEWRAAGRLNHNPERSAGFVVLKAPDFPSVLIEIGYLSSRQDVKSMKSAEWRTKATDALASAIERFFTPRGDAQTPAANHANEVEPVAKNGESIH